MSQTATSAQAELRVRASVLIDFEPSDLLTDDVDVDAALAFLDEDCELVPTRRGPDRWTITDALRRQTLATEPISELRQLRQLREQLPTSNVSPLQYALDRSLRSGWASTPLSELSLVEARALSVVADWWDGNNRPTVPDATTVATLVEQLSLFADVRAMASDHFIGRHAALEELNAHLWSSAPRPLVIYGLGGIGKSALIANHIVSALDDAQAKVALLDFDDPTLNPNYPADLVNRIVDLISRQLGGEESTRYRLRQVSRDIAANTPYASQSSSRASHGDSYDWEPLIANLLAHTGDRILVVMDTVEQVQRRGPSAVSSLSLVLDALSRYSQRIRVVLSGRAELPEIGFANHYQLCGLERDEAVQLLSKLAPGMPHATAETLVGVVGTAPLTIRLTARLLAADGVEASELFPLQLMAEQIDAELYRRVLAHIGDPDVRKLAHPGLVLRRITPSIIGDVLAGPCGVHVADEDEARNLFERMANEAMLVERSPDRTVLTHRADIRRMMLPQLLRDRPNEARLIQKKAVSYYAKRHDSKKLGVAAKVEELYHRLMLGQAPATLDKHWDNRAADQLAAVRDELPHKSRVYLTTRLPETYLTKQDRRLIDDSQWADEVQPQILALLAARDPAQALELLRERRGEGGSSLLPALEIEALEAAGELVEAAELARHQRRSAAQRGSVDDVVTYTLHLARLLERTGETAEAAVVLDEAISAVSQPGIDRMRIIVAWLGFDRRHRNGEGPSRQQLVDECIELRRQLGKDAVRRTPGLLRDLAAEAGGQDVDLLQDALRNVGLNAESDGSVPTALRDLADDVAIHKGAPVAEVAEIARLPYSGSDVSWEGIVEMPRGETGKVLSEVIGTYGESAAPLGEAVTLDYQAESDSAYLES
jgi:hypothetical protein